MKTLILFLLCCLSSSAWTQKQDLFEKFRLAEDSLVEIGKAILQADDFEIKGINNFKLKNALYLLFQDEKSMDFAFDRLTNVSLLKSDDNRIRIITWMEPLENQNFLYHGFIQIRKTKKAAYQCHELIDKSAEMLKPSTKKLRPDEWYGALYYSLITTKQKKQTIYTLLGYDANTAFVQKKLIDCILIDDKHQVSFGAPIFSGEKYIQHRFFFQYAKDVSMSLRYHPKKRLIIFDHLVPNKPSLEGMYEFYGPDFSYDAFLWEKGKWIFQKDVDARNDDLNEGNKSKKVERKILFKQ